MFYNHHLQEKKHRLIQMHMHVQRVIVA